MRIRNVTWEEYGISENNYKELMLFCRQYDEKKKKIKKGDLYKKAYERDIKMIDDAAAETAKEAGVNIKRHLIKSVTQGATFETLEYDRRLGRMPVGKTEFYGYRRLFYSILNKKKINRGQNESD